MSSDNALADALRTIEPSAFGDDDRYRLASAIPDDTARTVAEHLRTRSDWHLTMNVGGQNARVLPEALAAYPKDQREQLSRDLYANAAKGRGFHYDSIDLTGDEEGPLGDLFRTIQSSATLQAVSELTGEPVASVSGQATRYRPGQWLTRHKDDPRGETRRLAYVLSLTERWHPDWGGLLQFFEDDGTPRDAWMPGLGVLSLFHVRHVHSVTYVAPWAEAPRLAVTGWFSA